MATTFRGAQSEALCPVSPPFHGWDAIESGDKYTVQRVILRLYTEEFTRNQWINFLEARFPDDGSVDLYCFTRIGMVADAAWAREFIAQADLKESVVSVSFDLTVQSISPPGASTGAIIIKVYTPRYGNYLDKISRSRAIRRLPAKSATVVPEKPSADCLFGHSFPADMPEYHAMMLSRISVALLELESAVAPAADQVIVQHGPGRFEIRTSGYQGVLTIEMLERAEALAHVKTVQVKLFQSPPALDVRFVLPGSPAKRILAEANDDSNALMSNGLRAHADDGATAHLNLTREDLEPSDRSRRQRVSETPGGPGVDENVDIATESLFAALGRRIGI